ncbi:SMP-30/gluconolactonase/LRE family protein [Flagellimonas sp. CMM7]|uniref:SMP-30/gluconolactonase/LRE family protein n=1 Tax=Flagellimonas sp. CMM7 TaxID=2654676 RepID=UPI0013D87CF9|nr:SMP-30/gluconolactonase/LRE family protein [Flagellimonas sp. CMM7]UII80319.1 SMP-30/gluconolactonase/LRE family protein [Flagellimonas sp. CMM7]
MKAFIITYKVHLAKCILLKGILIGLYLIAFSACRPGNTPEETASIVSVPKVPKVYKTIGKIERISSEIDAIIPKNAIIEVLGEGLVWAEGPLWIPEKEWVLCSDVKENRILKWSEEEGVQVYLEHSGFTGKETDSRERGSNGLALDKNGNLVLCQHGNRQVARMKASLESPKPDFEVLSGNYDGWRLNSPNDLVFNSKGDLYFTDPPYGLSEKMMNDPNKELPFQGVYRLDKEGKLILLTDKVSRPNGLAFSPDEKTLYVANTDGDNAAWLAFDVLEDGTLGTMEEILNVTDLIGKEVGFPDGVKVDNRGNIFTAGPGGLWIFSPEYKLIGKIKPGEWVSNCAFNNDYSELYITADSYLLRVKLHT